MVSGLVVVYLMDGNSGMNDVWLNGLFVNYRLDGFMYVVVHMLPTDRWSYTLALGSAVHAPLVLELSLFLNKTSLRRIVITVVKLAMLHASELGSVSLGQDFPVLYGLYGAVIVILVHFLIHGGIDFFMLVGLHSFVSYCGSDCFVNCCVMVSRSVGEISKRCLDFVHGEIV